MARPKRAFTDDEIELMGQYALNGGLNNTIAVVMNIPMATLKRRFGKMLMRKRAERKLILRENQTKQAKTSVDMQKFLGQNELGQTNKQVIETKTTIKEYTEAELEASRAAATVYKLRLSGGR